MKNKTELKLSSDLMQNFKALRPAVFEKNMQAICCDNSKAFLSISDDGKLFVTAEQNCSSSGWKRTDISAGIRSDCGADAKVIDFSVNTDRDNTIPVLAAVVFANGKQQIYISANGSMVQPSWIKVPLPEQEIFIMVEGNRIVDINGSIYSFKGNPICVKSTSACDIKITELSESVYAAKFTAWIDDINGAEPYDPSNNVVNKLFALENSDKLSAAVITAQTGETEYLVPKCTPQQSIEAVGLYNKSWGNK